MHVDKRGFDRWARAKAIASSAGRDVDCRSTNNQAFVHPGDASVRLGTYPIWSRACRAATSSVTGNLPVATLPTPSRCARFSMSKPYGSPKIAYWGDVGGCVDAICGILRRMGRCAMHKNGREVAGAG